MNRGDRIRELARRQLVREERATHVEIKARVPHTIKETALQQLQSDGITMRILLMSCIESYIDRDPAILAMIEHWRRKHDRSTDVPLLGKKGTAPIFSRKELTDIWGELKLPITTADKEEEDV